MNKEDYETKASEILQAAPFQPVDSDTTTATERKLKPNTEESSWQESDQQTSLQPPASVARLLKNLPSSTDCPRSIKRTFHFAPSSLTPATVCTTQRSTLLVSSLHSQKKKSCHHKLIIRRTLPKFYTRQQSEKMKSWWILTSSHYSRAFPCNLPSTVSGKFCWSTHHGLFINRQSQCRSS